MTRYLLEGTATPDVYAAVIRNPEDRAESARKLMAKAGCNLVDYYFGINNYKTYVIVDCPNNETLAAIQFVLFSAGGMTKGTAVQIVSSADVVTSLKKAGELAGSYGAPE